MRKKTKAVSDSLSALLADSVKRKPSGAFIMIPFRIFEMLRFPKTKRFFSPEITDEQFFSLLPGKAASLLKDLMELENPADRLSAFQELESGSELAIEIGKKLQEQTIIERFGFKPGSARKVIQAGGGMALEGVTWLSDLLKSPDPRTKKMLLFLLHPLKKGKQARKEMIDRLEFTHLPVPRAGSSEDFMMIIEAAYTALRLGFPFKR